jgi:serine/threonine-protein kinase
MTSQRFGRYEIVRELARGGMARVYEARDPRIGREVAVKVLSRELSQDPAFLARFEREARTIASLEHPAIVPIYDFGEQEGQSFLVMRYMRGGSLVDRIRTGRVPLEQSLAILGRIAGALEHAHDHGVIHRDLKPGNILFDLKGEAYLGDFGIAHLSGEATTLTAAGAVLGTPAYMSPEQVHGNVELDGRSDVYSLGVILFEMLSGRQPYHADTPAKVMMQHLMDPVPRIREFDPDLPPDWEAVFQRVMAKSREDRYPTPGRLTQDVRTLASQGKLAAASEAPGPGPTLLAGAAPAQGTTPALKEPAVGVQGPASAQITKPDAEAPTVQGQGPIPGTRSIRRRIALGVLAAAMLALLGVGISTVLKFADGTREPDLPAGSPTQPAAAALSSQQPTRPAAAPLPAATPTLAPEFYGIRFCDRPCDSPGATGITTLAEGTDSIYFAWSYRGMTPGIQYSRTWAMKGDEWLHFECEWQGASEGTMEATLREPNGLRSGPWTLTLRIGGQPAVDATVLIEGTHSYWDPAGSRPCPDFP